MAYGSPEGSGDGSADPNDRDKRTTATADEGNGPGGHRGKPGLSRQGNPQRNLGLAEGRARLQICVQHACGFRYAACRRRPGHEENHSIIGILERSIRLSAPDGLNSAGALRQARSDALYCGEAGVLASGLYCPSGLRMNFTTSRTGAEGKACLPRASWSDAAACRSLSLADSKSR